MAEDRLDDDAKSRRQGLLAAGDPRGEVADAWTAKQAVQELYDINDPAIALDWVRELADSCTDGAYAPEIRRLGRTLRRWAEPIAAWHASRATNGPVEAINNLAKRLKRVAFGLTNWTHWRIRVLLYAGKPDWSKLATSPRHPRELPKRWHTSRASSTSCRHRRVRRGCAARRRRRSRPREHEVLQLLARGLRNKEIGEELHLSPKTMMHHTVAIYRKLGVRGRAEAAVTAARDGLVVLG